MKIIFGASSGSRNYIMKNPFLEIDFLLDNDVKKHGTEFLGYEIKSPGILKELSLKNLRVIVASEYYTEIREQLIGYGLTENIHFWDGLKEINQPNPLQNMREELQLRAMKSSVDFILEYLNDKPSFSNRNDLLAYALNNATVEGLCLEFGVYKGTSINFISNKVKKVYGFDSFEGLPEDWREGYPKSTFAVEDLPKVNDNVELVVGWFDESLPSFLEKHQDTCAFIHIDCDLYSSTKIIFDALEDRIKPGTVLVFDEFFNYVGWQEGEYKAFFEFIERTNLDFEYLGYNHYHEQVAIKIV